MNNYFNNMRELMEHLINGGAITNMDDSCKSCWISLYKGNLRYSDGSKCSPIKEASNWRPVPMQWLTEQIQEMVNE